MQTTSPKPLPNYPSEIQADPRQLGYSRDQLLRFYSVMRLARTFEERLCALYRQAKILGAAYVGMGQEATSVGCASLLEPADMFSTVARNLSAWLYRGADPGHIMARWMGKDQSPAHGRDLGLFLADLKLGIAPYSASMASWIPTGAGYGMTFKWRGQKNIYLAFTGDGATSPGDFYEGLNFAAIHKLPLVVICEVNQFAYSTPRELQMPVEHVVDRAAAFNIYSEQAFGNDLFAVIAAAKRGIEHARNGHGPALIEFQTFRQHGHGEHDDMTYVNADLRAFWEARDPIAMYRRWLIERAGFGVNDLDAIDAEASARVNAAVEYAESLPYPAAETVANRVFAPSPHDPQPGTQATFEPIETPVIPSLIATRERQAGGGHF